MNSGNTNGAWCCPQYSEVTLVMTVSVLWKLVSDLCETGSWESLPASLLQSLLYLAEAMESEMVNELVELWRLHSFLQSAIPWWHWSTLVSSMGESAMAVPALYLYKGFILFTVWWSWTSWNEKEAVLILHRTIRSLEVPAIINCFT